MNPLYHFETKNTPKLSEVGGKGLSLIHMTQKGLPVPPGFVLTVGYFKNWFDTLMASPQWQDVLEASPETLKKHTDGIKTFCGTFTLNDEQKKILKDAAVILKKECSLFAVRSSSPEEDLEGASFAGGYETVLGVTEDTLEEAVKRCFASCLDERVFVYKKEQGFDVSQPKIAVIVQAQVASETSGVAFSLNPLNNCYDEGVINANYGLGESVVAGQVTPDSFIVDKVGRKIIETKIGTKETAVFLDTQGGTFEKTPENRDIPCLDENQLLELTDMLNTVEKYYEKPMDTEWAFANGTLYMLQARPITAYTPLPDDMVTAPGEQKRIYCDFTLVGQGIQEPLSVLGLDYFQRTQRVFMGSLFGKDVIDIKDGLFGNSGGRSYIQLSNFLKMMTGRMLLTRICRYDALALATIDTIDKKEYTPKKLPQKSKGMLMGLIKGTMSYMKPMKTIVKDPEGYQKKVIREEGTYYKDFDAILHNGLALTEKVTALINRYGDFLNHVTLPMTSAATMALGDMQKLLPKNDPERAKKITYLERALPNNITIEMGLAMYRLSQFDEIRNTDTPEAFVTALEKGTCSAEFTQKWNEYIEDYGFRCPKEFDMATPRYTDHPGALFIQLKQMSVNTGAENNPQAVFDRAKGERELYFEELYNLISAKSKGKGRKFKEKYTLWVTFGGYREVHKYYTIKMVAKVRAEIVKIAELFVSEGRLENTSQIFDLKLQQIEDAMINKSLNLTNIIEENKQFLRKIEHFKTFPTVIDSRGKIHYPPRPEMKEGEIGGDPISPGIVRGKIKVLHTPDEKPVLPGEILVARATDPGWTPLFVNAGGVILEIGGMLQHGAVVAREYGKPCVAGVDRATEILKDGMEIEMDGANGIIRLL